LICPVCTHADAKISAALAQVTHDQSAVMSHHTVKAVTVASAARKAHNVHIVKKISFNFLTGKNFESVLGIKSLHDTVAALYVTVRLVHE
jgi:hypothetical protein